MTVGKKLQTTTKVARKSILTAAAGKPSTSTAEQDPDYEPDEGGLGSLTQNQTQRMSSIPSMIRSCISMIAM